MTSRLSEIDAQITKLQAEKQKLLEQPKYPEQIQNYIDRNRILESQLRDVDYWDIYGENPDMNSPSNGPFIETVQGSLLNAIRYSTTLKDFYSWGCGGNIVRSQRGEVRRV